jgi:8-amino-7-oxononanoate synthase
MLGTVSKAMKCKEFLAENGFCAACIRPPTVPAGASRLRINITAAHKEKDIERLAENLIFYIPSL